MPLLHKLSQYLRPARRKESEPADAYDIWASSYDNQPDNLMLALDESLVATLLGPTRLTGKVIADVGCGTGRHWKKLFDRQPSRLMGFDVSAGMLNILRKKYPQADTFLLTGPALTQLEDASCDLLLSTPSRSPILPRLLAAALAEWNRVLRPGGEMIITDYHPDALAKGGQRTFREGDRVIAVRNHVYPLPQLRLIARRLGLHELILTEKKIDDTMKPYYEKQNALPTFQRFLNVPIIYGIHLKKPDAAQ